MQLSFLQLKDGRQRYSTYFFIFSLTFLLGLVGTHARLSVSNLSVFWPVNAVDAALIYRLRLARKPICYIVAYAALVIQNSLSWGWLPATFTLNAANIVFIFVLAEMLTRSKTVNQDKDDIAAFFHVILACFVASVICAAVGAPLQQGTTFAEPNIGQALFSWFSEQFFTAMICLPILLSVSGTLKPRRTALSWKNTLPLLSLLVSQGLSLMIGPFAILLLTLPALTWCAVVYPLWLVQTITLCTGCLLLIMASLHLPMILGIWGHSLTYLLAFLRLCIAAGIFSPLLMAIYAGNIRRLNLRLKKQASYDFLTNTLSRYGLSEVLNQYSATRQYHDAGVNMMLIDADHFKKINDNFGHACGDEVLKHIAAIINETVPTPRLVSRIGGEEFVVVCFGYAPPVFYALADTVRRAICDSPFSHARQDVSVTISIGVAHAEHPSPDLEKTVWGLFPLADENLYTAKREGRNRTVQ